MAVVDTNTQIFNNVFSTDINAQASEYDIVFSFFKKLISDVNNAETFTTSLFQIARDTNVPVLTVLSSMSDQDALSVTNTIAFYLNGTRESTSLLGVSQVVVPNIPAARNVLK
jgi:hypothetical protein